MYLLSDRFNPADQPNCGPYGTLNSDDECECAKHFHHDKESGKQCAVCKFFLHIPIPFREVTLLCEMLLQKAEKMQKCAFYALFAQDV